jgi:hypothetical protein
LSCAEFVLSSWRPTKAEILRRAAAAGDREEEEKEMKKLKS